MATPIHAATDAPARILVAWRPGSPGTEAIDLAAWLSRTVDVQIRVVSTFLRPWPAAPLGRLGGKYRKWFQKEAEACEAAVKRALSDAGVDKASWSEQVSVFLDGPSESVLLSDAANSFDAHLVILGSDAAAPKGRFLAGSTADALLHSSPKPLGLAPRAVKLAKRGVTRVNYAFLESEIDEMNDTTIRKGLEEFDVIIHATKVGLYPKTGDILFDPALLSSSHLVCDVVYVPMETKLLVEAEKRGCRTLSGLWMNVYQAAEQMRLWAGIEEPPIDFMYQCGIEYLRREGKLTA